MQPVRLVLFDCDGTLVDSQGFIVECIRTAFNANQISSPTDEAARSIIGLSLPHAMSRLAPDANATMIEQLVQSYQTAFHDIRASGDFHEPMYDGAMAAIDRLKKLEIDLGIVTGKGRRGLDTVLDHHKLTGHFITTHTGDVHPSKPHPAMVHAAMLDAGAEPHETVVIGDTSFDIEMAKAAGCRAIGVSWGYHPVTHLQESGADTVIHHFDELMASLGLDEFQPQ